MISSDNDHAPDDNGRDGDDLSRMVNDKYRTPCCMGVSHFEI